MMIRRVLPRRIGLFSFAANAWRIAVMNMPQMVSGKRNIVMPGARIWMIVVM